MRVSFITSTWLEQDGFGAVLSSFVDSFQQKGDEVTVYHDENEQALISAGVVTVSSLTKLLDIAMSGCDEFLFKSDIVFVSYLTYYPLMEICRFINPGRLVFLYPGITPSHHYPDHDPLKKFTRESLSHLHLLRYGDSVIVNSNYMAKELAQTAGLDSNKIKVIPLAVSEAECPVNKAESVAEKGVFQSRNNHDDDGSNCVKSWGDKGHEGPLLLYIGRITGNKKVDLLIEGVALLRESFPCLKLIIGGMHSRIFSNQYMDDLKSLIEELDIGENVVFKGNLTSLELSNLYRKADLFVTASLHEGFCLPVAEALSYGLPSVVPHVTATKETMGEGGLVYKAGDMSEFAEAVSTLLTNRILYTEISQKALKQSRHFTPEVFRANLAAFAERLVSSGKSDGGRGVNRINLWDAISFNHVEYKDFLSFPLLGPIVKWFRRKVTFPLEKSIMRPVIEQQSLWNQLMVKEVLDLKGQIEALEAQSEIDHDQSLNNTVDSKALEEISDIQTDRSSNDLDKPAGDPCLSLK